ncbi:MAG: UvrD-helicase domain-containing protein [Vampirovibrionales bacterium]
MTAVLSAHPSSTPSITALNLLEGMNEAQAQAVAYGNGPLLVLAGAGSGKTRVLTHRIAHKLQQGIEGPRLLAVTFTNKAAREMKERLAKLVGESVSKDVWVGTFHSVCGRILRREIHHYQTPPSGQAQEIRQWTKNFVIYDEDESMAAIKAAIAEQNLDPKLYVPKSVRAFISECKNRLLTAHDAASKASEFKAERMARIYDSYESILARHNALDFDDLLLITVKLLQQHPAVLQHYHHQFNHILVDEFQDTNETQYELIRLLAEGDAKRHSADTPTNPDRWSQRSLTVVGDVDQSIYSWRGANFRICLNFQTHYPTAPCLKLLKNYRSQANILAVANAIIEKNDNRLPKELQAVHDAGEPITCYEAKDELDEAHFVVDQLEKLTLEHGYLPGQCCILYRTNVQSRALEDVLITRGIAYTMIGGLKFYERREIRDVMAYLTTLFNDHDGYSVKRILNVPKRGIGKTTLDKLETYGSQTRQSLYQVLQQVEQVPDLNKGTTQKIQQFVALIEGLKVKALQLPLDELLLAIIEDAGLIEFLKAEDPGDTEGRVANVEEFVNVTRQFMALNPTEGLPEFLTQMALLSDIDSAEPAENKLVLMTLHAAKGLEFKVVFLVGLEEGLFPHMRSLHDRDGMEEERRLMYVGVTRAEERLYLTFARRRMVFGETQYAAPSRFLKEAPSHLLSGYYNLDTESGYGTDENDSWGRRGPLRNGTEPQWAPRSNRDSGRWATRQAPTSLSENTYEDSDGRIMRPIGKSTASASKTTGPANNKTTDCFETGDRVRHAKFGTGTVDQVLGSDDKRLYNIQFDSIATKKLLDPRYVLLERM